MFGLYKSATPRKCWASADRWSLMTKNEVRPLHGSPLSLSSLNKALHRESCGLARCCIRVYVLIQSSRAMQKQNNHPRLPRHQNISPPRWSTSPPCWTRPWWERAMSASSCPQPHHRLRMVPHRTGHPLRQQIQRLASVESGLPAAARGVHHPTLPSYRSLGVLPLLLAWRRNAHHTLRRQLQHLMPWRRLLPWWRQRVRLLPWRRHLPWLLLRRTPPTPKHQGCGDGGYTYPTQS